MKWNLYGLQRENKPQKEKRKKENSINFCCFNKPAMELVSDQQTSKNEVTDNNSECIERSVTYSNGNFTNKLFRTYKSALMEMEINHSWKRIPLQLWSSGEVLDWLFYIGQENNINFETFSVESFQDLTGKDLISMRSQDFDKYERYGKLIFTCVNIQKLNDNYSYYNDCCVNKPTTSENYIQTNTNEKIPDESEYEGIESGDIELESNIFTAIRKILPAEDGTDIPYYTINHNETEYRNIPMEDNQCSDFTLPTNIDESDFISQIPLTYPQQDDQSETAEITDHYQKSQFVTLTDYRNYDSRPDSPTGSTTTVKNENNLQISHCSKSSKEIKEKVPKHSSRPADCKEVSSRIKCNLKEQNTKKSRAGTHLWEFIRDLLHDDQYNPKYIKWEDPDSGVFRFVVTDKVAELWGERKQNKCMTYEKLSRAMRFSRSVGYFTKIRDTGRYPKKLCFQFGEKASGWKKKTLW